MKNVLFAVTVNYWKFVDFHPHIAEVAFIDKEEALEYLDMCAEAMNFMNGHVFDATTGEILCVKEK